MNDFKPMSSDAMFAMIMTEVRVIKETLSEMRDEARTTKGSVRALEQDKWYQRGVVATIAVIAAAVWDLIKTR